MIYLKDGYILLSIITLENSQELLWLSEEVEKSYPQWRSGA